MMRCLLTLLTLTFVLKAYSIGYVYVEGYGIKSAWSSGDEVGIFAENDTQTRFRLQTISGSDTHQAQFYGYGISLKNQKTYYSFSPYSVDYYMNDNVATALPIAYPELTQSANNSTAHIAASDYQVANVTTTTENTATLTYSHLGTVIRLSLNVPEDVTFKQAKLTTDRGAFVKTGTLNLQTRKVTAGTSSTDLTLSLGDIVVARGSKLTLYFIALAANLNGGNVTATLTASNGDTYTCTFAGRNYEAGKLYNIERTLMPSVNQPLAVASQQALARAAAEQQSSQHRVAGVVTYPTCVVTDYLIAYSDINNAPLPPVRGDANGDGVVNDEDKKAIHCHVLGRTPTSFYPVAADANRDGQVNVGDIEMITKMLK